MRKVGSLAVILLALYFAVRSFQGNESWEIINNPPQSNEIVAFGDSITFGQGANPQEAYPEILSRLGGVKVINAGRNGETTETALGRLEDVINAKPGIVLVFLGGNDIITRMRLQNTLQNLTTIFTKFQEQGMMVAFVALDHPNVGDNWQMAIEHLCKEKGVLFISGVMKGIWGDNELMADTVHPNAKGYKLVGQRIYEQIKDYL